MNWRWFLIATAASLFACNKSGDSAAPTASAASSATPNATATAAVAQPGATAQARGDVPDPALPSAEEAEDTRDITARSYKIDLDGLEKEIAGLK